MKEYKIEKKELDGVSILGVWGYFDEKAGEEVSDSIDELLEKGSFLFVMDFSDCKVINSPGIAAVIGSAWRILDDHKGQLVLCGLDSLKTSVLTLAGLLPMLRVATTVPEGVRLAKLLDSPES